MATSRKIVGRNESTELSGSGNFLTPTNILYDLNIFTEWSQDVENANRIVKETTASGLAGKFYSTAHRSLWTFLRSVGVPHSSTSPCNLPVNLVKLVNIKHSWCICLSPDGEYLAVLQETIVEVRSRRDNYGSVIGKSKLGEDASPQWRHMAWSDDSQVLAVSSSAGSVTVLDIMCGEFFTLNKPETAVSSGDLSSAIASIIFSKPTKGTDSKWDVRLTLINHQGLLTSYLISTEECIYESDHSFLFTYTYPRGISSAVYSEKHALLIVTGLPNPSMDVWQTQAGQEGITAWRVLSGSPYYKMVTDYEQQAMSGGGQNFLRKFKSALHGAIYGDGMQELVFKSCLSPDGKHLLTLSTESKLCLYQVPSLNMVHSWSLDRQPCADQMSPSVAESPRKTKYLQETPYYYHLLDVEWWSNEEIILARYSGAVLVADIESLSNKLGESPEWFEVNPQVQQAHDGGFLSLECECRMLSGRKRSLSESANPGDDSDSDDESESRSIVKRTTRVLRNTIYYITDMDRFEPPKKKTKLIKKTYRLVSLKSTTPDELFARKIDHEEYGEALVLAKLYHLDSDLVYQRQWRKSNVTLATIHDYLSKIKKRAWVLHECLERVPTNIDAMRELLQYGLKGTDLEALVKIGQGRDKGRFIISKEIQLEESYDDYDQDSAEELEQLKKAHRENLLSHVDFENLTLEQKELCRVRLRLLTYLDRLSTYEEILGGGRFAEEHFDAKFFQKFRSQNVLEAVTDYARVGDWKAVDIMFIFLGEQTLPHRLAILSNLPETLPPSEYSPLIPLVEDEMVVDYHQESLREPDWCELSQYRHSFDIVSVHAADFLYEDNKVLLPFKDQGLTPDLLTDWFVARSCDMERRSRLVDHALQFIELGMKNGVKGLDSLHDDFSVMEMIVYECNYGDKLSFEDLQRMDDLDRLKVVMSKSTADKYAVHIQKWMRPFLEKCESKKAGSFHSLVRRYLKDLAVTDLQFVFKVFECSKADQPADKKILRTEERLLSASVDCIYACERDDQLSFVLSILECLPNRRSGDMERSLVKLHNEVDELELLISAAEILETYGVNMTISALRDSQDDVEAATMLMKKLTRRANNRTPSLSTSEWTQLQSDMAVLQTKVYRCIDKHACCEIFVESLLCSGKPESIKLSLSYMEGELETSTQSMTSSVGSGVDSQIPYEQAIGIVVRAAKEYFNASGSHNDENMRLAELCLELFSKPHESIKEELDLISALPLMQDFNIFTLPLRVRLCENRLNLIDEALQSSTTAYKQYPKLLKLSEGLRLDERAVLRLIVQQALTQGDSKFAYKHCKNLMEKEYPDIWAECYQLASSDTLTDTDARMALLSYSLVYCSDDMIEEVLEQRMILKHRILAKRMDAAAARRAPSRRGTAAIPAPAQQDPSKPTDWQTMFTAEGAVGALTKTTTRTKNLLSNLGDIKWIDKTVSLISGRAKESGGDEQAAFTKQGCHPFYEDIIPVCQPCIELAGSKRLDMSFFEDVLRTTKLKETLAKGTEEIEDCSDILVNCAAHTLPTDVSLGLGFLLAIPKPGEADSCFRELPHVPLTLLLGAYYYALQLLSALSLPLHGTVSDVIKKAQDLQSQQLSKEEPCELLYERLDLYVRLMEDHSQACYLQTLGKDVDGHRFTADNHYKKQSILSLARSMDQLHYDTAISMAKRYSVAIWDVYVTHLHFLFIDSGLTAAQVDKRIDRLKIVDELLSRPSEFLDYMNVNVKSHIEGTDMAKLQLYYKLIENCPGGTDKISAETHRKLLSKLIPAAPGLNYGVLMEAKLDAVDIIRPVLKSGNVHVFSKLSAKIPTSDGGYLSSSSVFNAWAQKLFIDGPSANSKTPESTAAWVHRYESCGEFVNKMDPQDNVSFVRHALFSQRALDLVPLDARQEICRRNTKYCRLNTGKNKQADIAHPGSMTWSECLALVQTYQEHLERMGSESLIGLWLAEDTQVQSYHKKIDASMGESHKLRGVLVEMLLDGQALELVHDILEVIPVEGWSVRSALTDAVSVICQHLRDKKLRLSSNDKQTMTAFENLIRQVGDHQREEGDLVSSEDVMSLFRPLIPDTSISIDTKLRSLTLLEQNFTLNEEDKLVVLVYQTQAVTVTHWPDREVKGADVNSVAARTVLFEELLVGSVELEQFLALSSLLGTWPQIKNSSSLWIQLIERLLSTIHNTRAAENVLALCLTERLSNGVVQQAYSFLKDKDYLHHAAMLALNSHSPVLREDVIDLISGNAEVFAKDDIILKAVFEHHLVVHFTADSALFKPLIEYLSAHQKEADFLNANVVVNEFLQAKLKNEAKLVERACRGQQGLRTLDAAAGAISAISRWWRKD